MKVIVNGEERQVLQNTNLLDLLQSLELSSTRVAIELNQTVIRRADWDKIFLSENDRIEIVHFVGGGASNYLN